MFTLKSKCPRCGLTILVRLGTVLLAVGLCTVSAQAAQAAEKTIVLVAGTPSHGPGAHEFNAGMLLLNQCLDQVKGFRVNVHLNGWPKEDSAFEGADAIVLFMDGGGGHPLIRGDRLELIGKLMKKGVGLACLHYAVEVPKNRGGPELLKWIGGYYERDYSINPHWTAEIKRLPRHPITRGVKPFTIRDEWYYHMRFRPRMKGVKPILRATPPDDTRGTVAAREHPGREEILAWVAKRPGGGRGFGFTGAHFHKNWGDENFRKLVLNALLWIAKMEVPASGVESSITPDDLDKNLDPKGKAKRAARSRVSMTPQETLWTMTVADDLEVSLFASEPQLVNPTNMDIDARGRVWVVETANYRKYMIRPEGDRIMILEDTDGDGQCDSYKTFAQDPSIRAPLGICVLGNKVYVAQSPNMLVYTIDESGDKPAGPPAIMFSGFTGENDDHGLHTGVFGPDGRFYFNAGNNAVWGHVINHATGEPVVDSTGSHIGAQGTLYRNVSKEKGAVGYQQGMAFRCDLDGSNFETLGDNFRNNYEVTVDSFGTAWQSDNDDDGNKSCRVNYLMEGGDFGYAGPQGSSWDRDYDLYPDQTTQEAHWHQRFPGVVPNLLVTGAGSPAGICVYEGNLLPERYHGALIHAEAGLNVVRAYLVEPSGAGYRAESVELIKARDRWFRPSDVCVAPDGSVFIADWYDPGVGGHQMGDNQLATLRGRIYRLAPPGHKLVVPKVDLDTISGQIDALCSPNLATCYLAHTKLQRGGSEAIRALRKLYKRSPNQRHRARALWLLARAAGGKSMLQRALKDPNVDIRVAALRAMRLIKMDMVAAAARALKDPSPFVWRELCLAMNYESTERCLDILVALADKYNGRDRWYLEAFGIGCTGREGEVLEAWLERGQNKDQEVAEGIRWRLLKKIPPLPTRSAGADPQTTSPDSKTSRLKKNQAQRTKDNRPLPSLKKLLAMTGDVQAGAKVFRDAKGAKCLTCHRIGKEGIMVGPPLSSIGQKLSRRQLYKAIVTPSASILMGYETWKVETASGEITQGIMVERVGDHVTLKDDQGKYHDIPTVGIVEKTKLPVSMMSDDLVNTMSVQDLVDLVEYLSHLK